MALPVPGSKYFLVPQCAPDMALGATDDNHTLRLRPITQGTQYSPGTQWMAWLAVAAQADSATSGMGFEFRVLLEKGEPDRIFGALVGGRNSAVYLEKTSPDPSVSFGIYDSDAVLARLATWNVLPNGDFFAIQFGRETSQNLNVAGNGPYPIDTPILSWEWSGGAPNELWKFVPFTLY
jgi:hypothetical protein